MERFSTRISVYIHPLTPFTSRNDHYHKIMRVMSFAQQGGGPTGEFEKFGLIPEKKPSQILKRRSSWSRSLSPWKNETRRSGKFLPTTIPPPLLTKQQQCSRRENKQQQQHHHLQTASVKLTLVRLVRVASCRLTTTIRHSVQFQSFLLCLIHFLYVLLFFPSFWLFKSQKLVSVFSPLTRQCLTTTH